jgi:ribosomal protein S13
VDPGSEFAVAARSNKQMKVRGNKTKRTGKRKEEEEVLHIA